MAINVCTETEDAIANGPYTDGDGTEDLYASIQECWAGLASDPIRYGDPYIPAGRYLISDELLTPYRSGVSLRGTGICDYISVADEDFLGNATILEFTGTSGDALLRMRAAHATIGNFCIDGGDLASQGILVTRDGQSGLGTGKSWLGPFSIWGCTTAGVQIGASIGDSNSDECEWEFVEVSNCESAVYFRSTNALGHHFRKLRTFQGVDNLLRVRGGGKSLFTTAQAVSPDMTIVKGEHESGGFGPNQSNFTFDNLITDSQTTDSFKLVDSTARYLDLTFRNWVHSNSLTDTYTGDLVTIRGMTQVLFDHCRSNFNGLTGTYLDAWGTPNITFVDCLCGVNPKTKMTGDINYRMYGCKDNRGEYYGDYSGMPYAKDDVRGPRVWTWPRRPRTVRSPVIVQVHPSFDGTLAFDLKNVLNHKAGIDSITSVTVSPSGPTITGPNGEADPAKDSSSTMVLFDIDGGQTDDTDYTFTCEVTTTDSDSALVVTGVMQCRD